MKRARKQVKNSSERGRRIAELRRSSASGTHGKTTKDRWNTNREWIEREQRDSE